MSLQDQETLARDEGPDPSCTIVRSRDQSIAVGLNTPDRIPVPLQHKLVLARLQIPHPQGRVARARDGQVRPVWVVLMLCSPLDPGWGAVIAILSIVVLRILTSSVVAVTAVAIIINITVAVVVGITGSIVAVGALVGNRQLV